MLKPKNSRYLTAQLCAGCSCLFLLAGWLASIAQAGLAFTSLHSFQVFTNGDRPLSTLIQGNDGNFYGTTSLGGTEGNFGTVFRISPNGVLTRLYSFTGGNDGANPNELLLGSDGYFYDTTSNGGTNGVGTVFKISTNGVLTSLHAFNGYDGAYTQAGLAQGSDGNFYGMAELGGTNDYGTVFKISTNGALTTLYSFTGGNDGAYPYAGRLVPGSDGSFYGMTDSGGRYGVATGGYGTVFKISTNGILTTLHSFTGGNDGAIPFDGLVLGSDGNFYGTTAAGGTGKSGEVFKISANGVITPLHSFNGGSDGGFPEAGLIQGGDGYFYGTTEEDGAGGYGTVFQISSNGAFTSLYSFTGGNDGAIPFAGLVQGSGGNFYGTTYEGGTNGGGTVFQVISDGALTSLYSFPGVNDGANPKAGLAQGSDGNFYGTTSSGGTSNAGTVFQLSSNGSLTSLYSFTGGGDGASPEATLVEDSAGNIYGTTYQGGASGAGTVFQININGALNSLYSFTGGDDGARPQGGLVLGSAGNIYGTTYQGGASGAGTVFQISPSGSLATLYSFTGFSGEVYQDYPNGLVMGSDGNFYGTTYGFQNGPDFGTVFEISTNGSLTILHAFTGQNDGGNPIAGLTQGSDGNFYGTTTIAGTNKRGTAFEISTNGALTTLHSFTGGNDGALPYTGLVQGRDGSFYGTTSQGGEGGAGTIFRLTVEPQLTITLSGTNVLLSWPANAPGFSVEYATNLVPPVAWNANLTGQGVGGGQNVVTNPITGTQIFYRLSQ